MILSGKIPVALLILCTALHLSGQENRNTLRTNADSIASVWIPAGYSAGADFIHQRIYPDTLMIGNELSVFEFLQGRVAGLNISQSSGDPGKSAYSNIRGMGWPLIVIDGIPWNNFDAITNDNNSLNEDLHTLIPVALHDIRSIEILKQGFATVLYGSEGSNGVILIETKKGYSRKPTITYQGNMSFHAIPEYPELLSGDEYAIYQLEAIHNRGIMDIPPEIAYDIDNPDFYNYAANTDWIKAVTQKGYLSNHFLNLTAGTKKSRVYSSVNYARQQGTIINTGYRQMILRMNIEHDFSEKLKLGIHLAYSNAKHDENPLLTDFVGYTSNILETAFLRAPNMSIRRFDANGKITDDYFSPLNDYQGRYYNPVMVSTLGNATDVVLDFRSTVNLDYKMTKWFKFHESFTLNTSLTHSDAQVPYYYMTHWLDLSFGRYNSFQESKVKSNRFRNELQASFGIPFRKENKNSLNGSITWISMNDNRLIEDMAGDLNVPYMHHESLDDKIQNNAAVVSIRYGLLNRYFIMINSRSEALRSNELNSNSHHYGIYAKWHFSREVLFSGLKFLDNGVLYAGWRYSKIPSYSEYIPWFMTSTIQPVKSYDAGINLELFTGRIQLNWSCYRNELEEIIDAENPYHNSGIELSSDMAMVKTRKISWIINITANWMHQSKGRSPGEFVQPQNKKFPIQSHGAIYGLVYDGIFANEEETLARDENGNLLLDDNNEAFKINYRDYHPYNAGDVKYKDLNYDGTIDRDDLVYLGSSFPKFTGGLGSTFRFKNYSFTCNFHCRAGYKIVNYPALNMESLDSRNNMSKAVLSRWRTSDYAGNYPRAYMDHPANALPSDRYVKPGDFLKLSYINLSYHVNAGFCRKIHIGGLVFSASAQRLFTLTGYNGMDPEIEIDYSPISSNMESIRTLPSRVITFSAQITL